MKCGGKSQFIPFTYESTNAGGFVLMRKLITYFYIHRKYANLFHDINITEIIECDYSRRILICRIKSHKIRIKKKSFQYKHDRISLE